MGATRAPWARDLLVSALRHAHPKVRRAVAAALGNFRDAGVAGALLDASRDDESYFVRAAALEFSAEHLASWRDVLREDLLSGWRAVSFVHDLRGIPRVVQAQTQ